MENMLWVSLLFVVFFFIHSIMSQLKQNFKTSSLVFRRKWRPKLLHSVFYKKTKYLFSKHARRMAEKIITWVRVRV